MKYNKLIYLMVFIIVVFAIYKVSSGSPVIEGWWNTSGVAFNHKIDRVICGRSADQNNQSSLTYNQNQIINPAFLNPSVSAKLGTTLIGDAQKGTLSQSSHNSALNDYNVLSGVSASQTPVYRESYNHPNNNPKFPVFQVPGNYQADLSPRMNSLGLNSFVKYNPPSEEHLASYANDPLTQHQTVENYDPLQMAKMVEAPSVAKTNSVVDVENNKLREKLKEQGQEVRERIPIPNMNNANCNEKEDVFYNADRYIFSLQKSRLYGLADPIRGDIPVIPCNPDKNPYSNTWFRPSVTPRIDLNAGALGILGGITNVTQQQLLQLQASSVGGSGTINGIPLHNLNTNVLQAANVNTNLGNSFSPSSSNMYGTDTVTFRSAA